METIELFKGLISIRYPSLLLPEFRLPLSGPLFPGGISLSKSFLSLILHLGTIASVFYLYRISKSLLMNLFQWVKSFRNAKKYLNSLGPSSGLSGNQVSLSQSSGSMRGERRHYAVIYKATNAIGRAFAFYLEEHGFNLILIDDDEMQLIQLT
jgi:hypothetical protein